MHKTGVSSVAGLRGYVCACACVRARTHTNQRKHMNAREREHVGACFGPHAGSDVMICICMFIKEKSVEQGAGEE